MPLRLSKAVFCAEKGENTLHRLRRCMATGFCSSIARLTSILGVLMAETCKFDKWPTVIVAILSITCGIFLIFLIPEPDAFRLREKTK